MQIEYEELAVYSDKVLVPEEDAHRVTEEFIRARNPDEHWMQCSVPVSYFSHGSTAYEEHNFISNNSINSLKISFNSIFKYKLIYPWIILQI